MKIDSFCFLFTMFLYQNAGVCFPKSLVMCHIIDGLSKLTESRQK